MTNETEVRSKPQSLVVDDAGTLRGYAALFNEPADLGAYDEVIRQGAFKRTLSVGKDIRALWSHDPKYVLGRTSNNTLRLIEDDKGLYCEIDLPPTTWAADLRASIQRGDCAGASFQFSPVRNGERRTVQPTGRTLRELTELKLFEISAGVGNPAYEKAAIRSNDDVRPSRRVLLSARMRILSM
jgi:uncharacterized protein